MTARIGLAVGRGFVRAVAIRNRRIVWAGEAPVASSAELQAAITALLAQAPLPRWPRPTLQAAIGPEAAQVKRVVGLPEIPDSDALAAIVREAVGTHFLKNGVALITTRVRPAGGGAAVAAALDRPYVDAIRAAGRAGGYKLGAIAPAAVALTHAFADPAFQWNDGPVTIEVVHTGPVLDSIRTRPARSGDQETPSPTIVPQLAALGADSLRYADAFGAAALDPREPLAVQPDAVSLIGVGAHARSLALVGLGLLIGIAGVALSPLAASWAEKRALADVAQLRPGRWQVVSTARGQLDRISVVLGQTRAFADSRVSVGSLLGELTRLLPDNSALVGFEWMEDRGEATVVTNDPGAVLAALRRLPDVQSVELIGSVTRQSVSGRDLQRVTIRFARKS